MAHNANPFTGRVCDPSKGLETPAGYIFVDEEDGLFWGDCQLAPNMKAGDIYRQLYGKDRPDTYKQYLAKLKRPADNAHTDQLEAGSADDVLDDDTESEVVVTNAKLIHLGETADNGFPGSVASGGVELNASSVPLPEGRAEAANVNLGSLGKGASKPGTLETGAGLPQGDTPETARARAEADKFGGLTAPAETDAPDAKEAAPADMTETPEETKTPEETITPEDDGKAEAPNDTLTEIAALTDDQIRQSAKDDGIDGADTLTREQLVDALLLKGGYHFDHAGQPNANAEKANAKPEGE